MLFIYQDINQFMELFEIDKMNFTMRNLAKSLQTIILGIVYYGICIIIVIEGEKK